MLFIQSFVLQQGFSNDPVLFPVVFNNFNRLGVGFVQDLLDCFIDLGRGCFTVRLEAVRSALAFLFQFNHAQFIGHPVVDHHAAGDCRGLFKVV